MTAFRRLAAAAVFTSVTAVAVAAQAPSALQVKITGHGAPMILIPGLASSGATWDSTVAHFQNRYTCYVLTLAGFAGVPAVPADNATLLTTVREQLATYMEQHHLDHAVIIGHSLGGNIALDLVEHNPQLTGPAVIVDSLPFYAGAWFGAKTLAQAQPIIAQMRAGMAHVTQAEYVAEAKTGASTNAMTMSTAHQQLLDQWGASSDHAAVFGATLALVSEDLRPGLAQLTSPVLVLGTWQGWVESMNQHGQHLTRQDFLDTFRDQYAAVPRLHFAMDDHSRHFIMWDDPAWFFQQLDAFLANPAAAVQARGF